MKKQNKTQRINAMLAKYPDMKPKDIAKRLRVSPNLVHQVKWQTKNNSEFVNKVFTKAGLKKPSKITKAALITKAELDALLPKVDPVNHPAHYKAGGFETIDFIEAKDLNYRLGNVVKYVSRAGKKDSDPLVDLKKARWYLDREIFAREGA
jgi:transposase